jgi:hypothetical protein
MEGMFLALELNAGFGSRGGHVKIVIKWALLAKTDR